MMVDRGQTMGGTWEGLCTGRIQSRAVRQSMRNVIQISEEEEEEDGSQPGGRGEDGWMVARDGQPPALPQTAILSYPILSYLIPFG
jgi:hypothetical protein